MSLQELIQKYAPLIAIKALIERLDLRYSPIYGYFDPKRYGTPTQEEKEKIHAYLKEFAKDLEKVDINL